MYFTADYITFYGNSGVDIIRNSGNGNLTLYGGAGNDSIALSDSKNNTISGGAGDNEIKFVGASYNNLIKYAIGDGNDFITSFNETDTLQIVSGQIK